VNTYEKDYEATMAAKGAALQKIEQISTEVDALDERLHALETLIRADYPHKGKLALDKDVTPIQALVNVVQPKTTERVRGILTAAGAPLTVAEICDRLKRDGLDLGTRSNPWAFVHTICRRLVEQGFAREGQKGSRKAWIAAK